MNVITDSPGVWRGPKPGSRDDIRDLADRGVRTIINLQSNVLEDDDTEIEQLRIQSVKRDLRIPLAFYHEPMSVVWPPTRYRLKSAVHMIEAGLRDGAVYVHCHDGVDRTGCVLWAYDVWVRNRPVYEAYSEMIDDGYHLWRYFWWLPFVAHTIREGR